MASSEVSAVMRILETVLQQEHRYLATPGYGEAVQNSTSMPQWRLQLIHWLGEVSFGAGGVQGAWIFCSCVEKRVRTVTASVLAAARIAPCSAG
jgi:hypothetical protein